MSVASARSQVFFGEGFFYAISRNDKTSLRFVGEGVRPSIILYV